LLKHEQYNPTVYLKSVRPPHPISYAARRQPLSPERPQRPNPSPNPHAAPHAAPPSPDRRRSRRRRRPTHPSHARRRAKHAHAGTHSVGEGGRRGSGGQAAGGRVLGAEEAGGHGHGVEAGGGDELRDIEAQPRRAVAAAAAAGGAARREHRLEARRHAEVGRLREERLHVAVRWAGRGRGPQVRGLDVGVAVWRGGRLAGAADGECDHGRGVDG